MNTKKINKKLFYLFLLGLLITIPACQKDTPKDLKGDNVAMANELLSGDIVLSTHAKMSGISKTLLPNGCPTKFHFEWNQKKEKLYVRLPKFTVGNMPFAVVFYCYTNYTELNAWEKEEYPEAGWIKFSGDDGVVIPYVPDGVEEPIADGAATIIGYVNPQTEEIEFIVNYNMMNVVSHCFRQKIDKSRIWNYEEEFRQFERDLKKYKEEHGL